MLKELKKNKKPKTKKKAARTIQERARAKIKGKETRKQINQINENYEIDNQCAICLDTMINNRPTTITKCKHKFHSECIDKWLRDHNTYPSCREILVERDDEEDEEEDDEEDDDGSEWEH